MMNAWAALSFAHPTRISVSAFRERGSFNSIVEQMSPGMRMVSSRGSASSRNRFRTIWPWSVIQQTVFQACLIGAERRQPLFFPFIRTWKIFPKTRISGFPRFEIRANSQTRYSRSGVKRSCTGHWQRCERTFLCLNRWMSFAGLLRRPTVIRCEYFLVLSAGHRNDLECCSDAIAGFDNQFVGSVLIQIQRGSQVGYVRYFRCGALKDIERLQICSVLHKDSPWVRAHRRIGMAVIEQP